MKAAGNRKGECLTRSGRTRILVLPDWVEEEYCPAAQHPAGFNIKASQSGQSIN